jgi:hypothetical protein
MKSAKGQELMKKNESKLNFYTGVYFFIGGAIMLDFNVD